MPTCFMMIGIPYSGKSYWIERTKEAQNLPIVSSDNEVKKLASLMGGDYNTCFKDVINTAIGNFKRDFSNKVSSNKDFIIDRTNLTVASRKNYLNTLVKNGYEVIAVVFEPPKSLDDKELTRRISLRKGQVIPLPVIERMIGDFEEPTKSEGFSKIIKIQSFK